MGIGKLFEITKTIITLSEDLKKSREEIKTLSAQLNNLAAQFQEVKIKFEIFTEKEFKNFTEQETLKRENFSETERLEREKIMQEINNIFAQAESAHLRRQVEELSKSRPKKATRKKLGDGKK
jgi:hypothetical protein